MGSSSRQKAEPGSHIPHVGTYRRAMAVSLERMYENALDWEHLPYVHGSSFGAITVQDSGRWGWRAALVDSRGRDSEIELRLDRQSRRWITRNLSGGALGSEIWTHVFVTGERSIEIVVDFFVPGVVEADRDKTGEAYTRLYHQLYDEDEAMMLKRQSELDERFQPSNEKALQLPPRAELRLPHSFELSGRKHVLREVNGELVAHAAVCPHQMGPLDSAQLIAGEIICPWHGYRFRLADGVRVNPGANGNTSVSHCALRPAPLIEENTAGVLITDGA